MIKKKLTWNFNEPVKLLQWENVHTVCEESACPNRAECSALNTATFLLGGKFCTRRCGFCHVENGPLVAVQKLRQKEEEEILAAVKKLNLSYVVLTSVTRDDDPEALAWHFNNVCQRLKTEGRDVELLIPDFKADENCLLIPALAQPNVMAHNMETVKSLSRQIRPQAFYEKSLKVLQYYHTHHPKILVKTGFMVGLGETESEIYDLIDDIHLAGADILTIGQYLQPGPEEVEVKKYYTEEDFLNFQRYALNKGLGKVQSGYFTRSSYHAAALSGLPQKAANVP